MNMPDIAAALQRARSVFRRRPDAAVHDDAPAQARWVSGTQVVVRHANGTQARTDMPRELGGTGDEVSPGWLFRAGLASCAATSIVLAAATHGVELESLEVRATSRSDIRGLLDVPDATGAKVHAGVMDLALWVQVVAPSIEAKELRCLIESCLRHSPVWCSLGGATAVELHVNHATA